MINKLLVAVLFIIGTISCKKDQNCHPASVSSTWTLGKDIIVDSISEYSIVDGENRLFEYNYSGAECENVMDDERGEKLTFIVHEVSSNFEYKNEEILETKCFYQEYGAWVRHNKYQIKKGIIKGEKISDNEWKVKVSVITSVLFPDEQPKTIEFTKIYSK
jgi:hypothetical protein